MPKTLPAALVPMAVLLVTAAVYLPTLDYEFVFDDHPQIVDVSKALTWERATSSFTRDLWSLHPEVPGVYYRPVFMLWLIANYQLFGLEPAWWHLSTIAAHLLCTLLVYFLARFWLDQVASGIAALLFGVHPVHVEGVAWISGVSEPLLGIFFLSSILCYLRWDNATAQSRRRALWLAASVGLYMVAMLAKETAFILPALILAWEISAPQRSRWRIAGLLALYGAAASVYFIARLHAIPGLVLFLKIMPLSIVVSTWPSMLIFYLKQLAWPVQMSELHYLPYVTHMSVRRLILPVLVLGALAYLITRWSRSDRVVGFASALLVIPIIPVLDFRAFGMDELVHDRYLYLPSVGFCLLLALAWKHLVPRISAVHLVLLLAVAAFLSYRTVRESAFWHDDLALFQHAYQVAPQHVMASEDLGQILFIRGRPADAMPYLERAQAMGTHNTEAFFDLGRIYFSMQDWDRAAILFEQAMRGHAKPARYLFYAGVTDFHLGRLQDAESELREAIRVRPAFGPDLGMLHLALAYVLEQQGDLNGALAECAAELREHPGAEPVLDKSRELQQALSRSATEPRQ